MNFRFEKSKRTDAYFVYNDETIIGTVRKEQRWTVRGKPTYWMALRITGKIIGRALTRNEAAKLLVNEPGK